MVVFQVNVFWYCTLCKYMNPWLADSSNVPYFKITILKLGIRSIISSKLHFYKSWLLQREEGSEEGAVTKRWLSKSYTSSVNHTFQKYNIKRLKENRTFLENIRQIRFFFLDRNTLSVPELTCFRCCKSWFKISILDITVFMHDENICLKMK